MDFKPRFDDFLNEVVCAREEPIAELRRGLYRASAAWMLRPHQTQVVSAFLRESARSAVALSLELSEETVKTRVAKILAKSGHQTMQEVVIAVLRYARSA